MQCVLDKHTLMETLLGTGLCANTIALTSRNLEIERETEIYTIILGPWNVLRCAVIDAESAPSAHNSGPLNLRVGGLLRRWDPLAPESWVGETMML